MKSPVTVIGEDARLVSSAVESYWENETAAASQGFVMLHPSWWAVFQSAIRVGFFCACGALKYICLVGWKYAGSLLTGFDVVSTSLILERKDVGLWQFLRVLVLQLLHR